LIIVSRREFRNVCVEKDIAEKLSRDLELLVIDIGSYEEALIMPPKQTRLVEFVLDKPLKKGRRYIVKVAFKEGIEARSEEKLLLVLVKEG